MKSNLNVLYVVYLVWILVISIGPVVISSLPAHTIRFPSFTVNSFKLAQTHVIPSTGLKWNGSVELHMVANRPALALFDLIDTEKNAMPILEYPYANILIGSQLVDSIPLDPPDKLPKSAGLKPSYSNVSYSCIIPSRFIKKGLSVFLISANYKSSNILSVNVGMGAELDLKILPFYVLGANFSTVPFDVAKITNMKAAEEFYQRYPFSTLNIYNHPGKYCMWSEMIYYSTKGPKRINNANQIKMIDPDGFSFIGSVVDIILSIKLANGDRMTNSFYYAPMILGRGDSTFYNVGGGIGRIGKFASGGDHYYSGVFIHEAGHSLGLLHSTQSYRMGIYPYFNGSLEGSSWGYDARGNGTFLSVFRDRCPKNMSGVVVDPISQQCYRQSFMQESHGQQSLGFLYSIVADYECGVVQGNFEGTTTVDPDTGIHQYSNIRLYPDPTSPSGYSHWDTIDLKMVHYQPTTDDYGLDWINQGLPSITNIPVHTIILGTSYSHTPDLAIIYQPLSYVGNLIPLFDPSNLVDLQYINPGGIYQNYCNSSGCDYTAKVTYTNGQVSYFLLKGAFRQLNQPNGRYNLNALNSKKSDSYKTWTINVPGEFPLSKVELLYTPAAYIPHEFFTMLSSQIKVLATWTAA